MNSSTSLPFTFSSIRAFTSSVIVVTPSFGYAGGELERVKLAAHAPAERGINRALLHHPRLATETLAHHAGGIMVAVAGKIGDLDLRIRDGAADQRLDLVGQIGRASCRERVCQYV